MQSYDVIVIGSGQAGLAAGYFLKKKGLSFALLDKGEEVGQIWKNRSV
ncbi:FAD-dependent oxidoreductase [Paenibacillus xerothermodurans]|uniref:FAD-binding protein n=1 Tax=Paenibacillus xerothermodurans TaxID=1977292 RepID=A0A2W1NCT5_PAEXE|nr:FAD-dependent oxidoreductase [Paenibacillus xerothermodurans]PZE20881.1 FAD-binding protein [Paenibacillus xerothermodurans]